MDGISDIKIVGIDPARPPRIQAMPCIDLFFELAHKAPEEWCDTFNLLMSKQKYSVRIDPTEGLFIETWVRRPDEIKRLLEVLGEGISKCSDQYIAHLKELEKADAARNTARAGVSDAQRALDEVVGQLRFEA